MYTLVRVRLAGDKRYRWTGYAYDVSRSGMRFELDAALAPGTRIEARTMLPGARVTTFTATGTVVRLHDDANDAGPIRMGLAFNQFKSDEDGRRLKDYLAGSTLRAAA